MHETPGGKEKAQQRIQEMLAEVSQGYCIDNLAALKPKVSVVSGHLSEYFLNYCQALKDAGIPPQEVYPGVSVYEMGGTKLHKNKNLTEISFYQIAGAIKDGNINLPSPGSIPYNSIFYPRSVSFALQSGEMSTVVMLANDASPMQ